MFPYISFALGDRSTSTLWKSVLPMFSSSLIVSNLFIYYYYYFTLQYCIGFAIHQHESATGTHVPHPEPPSHFPPHTIPLGHPSTPAPSILYPASNLVIGFIYDIIHVSMPFSQAIPSSPSPTESKRLFYTSVSLLLSCIQRDGTGREEAGAFRMGNTCIPVAHTSWYMAKQIQYCN